MVRALAMKSFYLFPLLYFCFLFFSYVSNKPTARAAPRVRFHTLQTV